MLKTTFLYPSIYEEQFAPLKEIDRGVVFVGYANSNFKELISADTEHLIFAGELSEIKSVMSLARSRSISMAIVPLSGQNKLIKVFDLSSDLEEAFRFALIPSERKIDMFYCNDTLVLDDVRIGNASLLKSFEYSYDKEPFLSRLKQLWKQRKNRELLRHHKFNITIDKKDEKHLSAVGAIALDYDNRSWMASLLKPTLSGGDGKQVLAILSPTSLFQYYISQPLSMLFATITGSQKLPISLGYIKSKEVFIECEDAELEVLIDDTKLLKTPVRLHTDEAVLAFSAGDDFWKRQGQTKSDRNSIKLDGIPRDDEQIDYLSSGLPLFEHASREQYASLFASLREDARLSSIFITLLILATMIATLGLFINSGSVIIGAMLLAPLMQPIVSLSMGALRQDMSLQKSAAKTIIVGVVVAILSSMFIALFVPIERLTSEMAGRLSPTILDLFVAIVSGIAAAYVKNNEKILSSLAGVAIAVALVPPLAVAGIGLGWGEFHMFLSAFLLFATNLVGIVLAAAATFMILGYSPIKVAQKALLIWFIIVVLVSIPLYSSFSRMQENARIQNILTETYFTIHGKQLELSHVEILYHKAKPQVRCEVISNKVLNDKDKAYLKDVISKSIGKDVEIVATFRYRL